MAIIYKISDVYSLSEEFKGKFTPLTKIESGEKLMLVNGRLVKDNNSFYVQSFTRWWDSQNRYDIISVLEEESRRYVSLLKFVYGAYNSNKVQKNWGKQKKQLFNIYKQHKNLISDIVIGLSQMKETYDNTADVANRIDAIINDLRYLPLP